MVSALATYTGRQEDKDRTTEHAEKITCWLPRARQGGGVGGGESVITFFGTGPRTLLFPSLLHQQTQTERTLVKQWAHLGWFWKDQRAFAKSTPEMVWDHLWPQRPPSSPLHPHCTVREAACRSLLLASRPGSHCLLVRITKVISAAGLGVRT